MSEFLEGSFPRAHSPRRTGGVHASYHWCNTQYVGYAALPAVTLNANAFVSDCDLDPNEHTLCLLIDYLFVGYIDIFPSDIVSISWDISYRYHAIYRMISVSRYPENIGDTDIDIARKY